MRNKTLFILLATFSILLLVTITLAAPSTVRLPWWTVDNGGGRSAGGSYTLRGTAGQPDGGLLAGGSYTLSGGYWGGPLNEPPPAAMRTYLPAIRR